MAIEKLGEAVVEITADLSQLRKDFETAKKISESKANESGDAFSAAFSKSAKKLGGVLAGVFAVDALVNFTKTSVTAFAEQEAALAKLSSVIQATGFAAGFTTSQMADHAAQLQLVTAYSDDTVNSMQAVLATFTSISGSNFKEATEAALDLATVMGGDAQGAALQLGKALENPIEGMSTLKRAGVTFTAAQKDVITKLVETGQKGEAQKVILDALKGKFGEAAEAAGKTFGGQLEQLKNAFGEVQESIGTVIAAGLLPFIANTKETANALNKSNAVLMTTGGIMQGALVAMKGVAWAFGMVKTQIELFWNALKLAFNSLVAVVVVPINIVIQTIVKLISSLDEAKEAIGMTVKAGHAQGFMDMAKGFDDYTNAVTTSAKETIKSSGDIVDAWLTGNNAMNASFDAAAQGVADAMAGVSASVKAANEARLKHTTTTNKTITDDTLAIYNLHKDLAHIHALDIIAEQEKIAEGRIKAHKKWADFMAKREEEAVDKMKTLWEDTPSYFDTLWAKIKEESAKFIGEEGIKRIKTLIEALGFGADVFTSVVDSAGTIASYLFDGAKALTDAFTNGIGFILSFPESAQKFGEGLLKSLESFPETMASFTEGLPGMIDSIVQQAPKVAESIAANMGAIITSLTSALPSLIPAFVNIATSFINAIISNLNTIIPALISAAQAFINAIIANLGTIIPALISAAQMFLNALIENMGTIIPAIISVAQEFLNALIDNADKLVQLMLDLVLSFLDFLIENFDTILPVLVNAAMKFVIAIIEKLPDIIQALIDAIPMVIEAFIMNLPAFILAIIEAVPKIILALVKAVPQIIVALIKAIPQFIKVVWDAFAKIPQMLWDLIKSIFDFGGLLSGIMGKDTQTAEQQAANAAWDDVTVAEEAAARAMGEYRKAQRDAEELQTQASINRAKELKALAEQAQAIVEKRKAEAAAMDIEASKGKETPAVTAPGIEDTTGESETPITTTQMTPATTVIDTSALSAAIEAFNDAISNFNDSGNNLVNAFHNVTNILMEAAQKFIDEIANGITTFQDLWNTIAIEFSKLISENLNADMIAIANLFVETINIGIKDAMDDLGTLGADIAATIKSLIGAIPTGTGTEGSAKGNIFDGARKFASGDVVSNITPFTYGNGKLGVMGEAGPEAIVPLERGADGKLGIKSQGGGAPIINITVTGSLVTEGELIDTIETALSKRMRYTH